MAQAITAEQPSSLSVVQVEDFEHLFLRFQTPIIHFLYHLVGNREQAYDLAQDVFVKAYKALLLGTIVQQGAFPAWLYRIAANTATDNWRRRRLISWIPLSYFDDDRKIGAGLPLENNWHRDDEGFTRETGKGTTSLHQTRGGYGSYDGACFEERLADREVIERILGQMPAKYSICLWLYEHDGIPCREIAHILQISESSVKMRLMRGRQQFIELYQQEMEDEE